MSPTLTQDQLAALQSGSGEVLDSDSPFAGYETEHIYIGDESADPGHKPRTVSKRVRIRNFARGVATELTYYDEGFVRLREGTAKQVEKDHTIELRFLDPDAEISRRIATGWLWTAAGMALAATVIHFLLPLTAFSTMTFATTTLLGTLGAIAFLLFVYKSEERVTFLTASGRAEVIHLVSSFGCIAKVRRAYRDIRKCIDRAGGGDGVSGERYLRAEMQAHYKLRETGVISQEACSDGTALILSKFG
jgi:hypothetical protein